MKLKKMNDSCSRRRTKSPLLWGIVAVLFFSFSTHTFAAGNSVDDTQQAGRTVTGSVTDETGEPLIGAAVIEVGTTHGTATDLDGNFTLTLTTSDPSLNITSIGFTPQTVHVGNRTTLSIVMVDEFNPLEELVVIGFGVQRRANLTGSVSTVDASSLENRALPNLSTALAGLAPGVNVRQTSGRPGGDGAAIRIRGLGTFAEGEGARGPLVLIDGVPGSMDAVNPNDVESMSILRDASSAAIFGSRAANGVIVITTRRGANVRPTVTYSGLFSAQSPSTRHTFLWDHAEYMELFNQAQFATNPLAALPYDPAEIEEWRAARNNPHGLSRFRVGGEYVPNWLAFPNTDWSRALFQNKFSQNHNVSVSGGSANSNFMLSLGYLNNPGVMQNTGLDRYSMRFNLETRINDFLRVGTQTFASRQDRQVGDQGNALTFLFQQISGVVPYHDGRFGGQTSPRDAVTANNLLRILNDRDGNERMFRLNTTWYAIVDIMEGLTAEARVNYQTRLDNNEHWPVSHNRYNFRTGEIVTGGAVPQTASTFRSSREEYRYQANLLLNYHRTFGEHSIGGMLGYEAMYWAMQSFNASRVGLLDMSITDITTGAEMGSIGGEHRRDYAMVSVFGRFNYVFRNRYLFEMNVRRDGSSRFAPETRWGTFPSFSAGWRISEEDFMEGTRGFVDNLMLRGSWGRLGNTTSGMYDWQATYAIQRGAMGGGVADGLAVTSIANPLLHWERVTSSEVGMNALFLNQRLNFEVNLYNRVTEGILTRPSIYLTMGMAQAPMQNTADMRNRGIEVVLGWSQRVNNDFRYSATFNFAYNQNRVIRYMGQFERGWQNGAYSWNRADAAWWDGTRIRTEGRMFNEFFLRQVYRGTGTHNHPDGTVDPMGGPRDGMIRTSADLQWVRDMIAAGYSFDGVTTVGQGGQLWYGEFIYADINGDGNFGNEFDRDFTGKSEFPRYTLGFTSSAQWRNFDFGMTWSASLGMHFYLRARGINTNNFDSPGNAIPANAREMFFFFNPEDPNDPRNNINAPYPRMLLGNGHYRSNTHFLYNASFAKLNFVQFGYTLPRAVTSRLQIERLRLFVSGENLLTITNYPGMDPEIGGAVNVYPISRVLSGGINITF